MIRIIIIALIIYNCFVMSVYAYDKACAAKRKWRVPEKTLILLALFCGGPGAFLGMQVFRHKTKHAKFVILVPIFMIAQLAIAGYLLATV